MKGDDIYRDMIDQRRELLAANEAQLRAAREGHMRELQAVQEDHMRELQAIQAQPQVVQAVVQAVRAELQAVQAQPQVVQAVVQAVRAENNKQMLVVGGIIISIGIVVIYLVFQ
ncbi:hypothetical protein OCU04_013087 [Sclerotinia nivalis]|uniref:Uncharacterized protein n=1 Tax=Sclerotinia nivalis TaxID=352851 RepID=A0A9X0A7Y3_9HELO|nr:hypothetical protein OCU04_013087 [Sclerotinia nivalis]